MEKAKSIPSRSPKQRREIRECYRQAYFNCKDIENGFWNFSKYVVGRAQDGLTEDKRYEFARFVTGPHPRKMLQAARGSWKSSIGIVDYAAWLIGRDMVLHNDESRIRILLASETEALSQRNLRGIRQIMEWRKPYITLVGNHKTQASRGAELKMWGKTQLTSRFRNDAGILEPTISAMGQDTERTGFHYDIILMDDLEAERTSGSLELIENCWEFYKLMLSILDPGGLLLLVCTRWHPDDIYARMEDQNSLMAPDKRFKILKIPADDGEGREIGRPNFPSVLSKAQLEHFREAQGPKIFNCQYRLTVVEDEAAIFQKSWVKFTSLTDLLKKKLNIYTTADFAWTEKSAMDFRKSKKADFTVVMTVAVDEDFRYHVLDWFRERCSKRAAVEELYRQYFHHNAIRAILQKYDRSQIGDAVEQYGYEAGKFLVTDWVVYPPKQGVKKVDRIETALAPLFESGKIFITRDMTWFLQEEYESFPKGKFDGFDCLCNIVHFAAPALKKQAVEKRTETQKRVEKLKAGTFDPNEGSSDDWRLV